MSRSVIDCRELPSEAGCSLQMSGEPEELERAAVVHALDVHKEEDTPELHRMIRASMRPEPDEMTFTEAPGPAPH